MPRTRTFTDEELIAAVKNSRSFRQVLIELGMSDWGGGSYGSIKRHIKRLNVDISHFTGQGYLKGKTHSYQSGNLKDILVKDSSYTNMFCLKNRLIKEGILQEICNSCFNIEWLGQPIPLELHHIDGDKNNLLVENLELLCPNCHALTDTYRGKNIR